MKPIIEVSGLSKSYQINHKNKASYSTLKDDVGRLLTHPFRKDSLSDQQETFWALKDVSFTVNPGEIFGIIGRNGSGKSTLLKILSRIVEPTSGFAKLHGRTASLLEVGTGFNPELTGRENIFFNGSMLGMSKKDIHNRFQEIVDFSEVEKFLDTPVKFYSSGMYVRLAFSVAAHLEPDILILDEVLSVGDAGFQKKSLNKIMESMNAGRTVIFVSHSMGSVQQLCSRGMLLNNGEVDYIGPVGELTEKYMALMRNDTDGSSPLQSTWENDGKTKNDYFVPKSIYMTDSAGELVHERVRNNEDHWFCVEGDLLTDSKLFNIGYCLKNQQTKSLVFLTLSTDTAEKDWPILSKGHVRFRGRIPRNLLNAGNYKLSLIGSLHNQAWIFDPEDHTPSVELTISEKMLVSPQWIGARAGQIAPVVDWEIIPTRRS